MSNAAKRGNLFKLSLIAVLFFGTTALATFLYLSGWRPQGTTNHGDLVQPARPITAIELRTLDGKSVPFDTLKNKWNLIYFNASECGDTCKWNLYKMRQVRLAEGKDATRVNTVLIITDERARDWLKYVLKDYPDMQVFSADQANLRALGREFALPAGTPLDNLGRIYVVDPLGYFMMSYGPHADPTGMRKDLSHLLRFSHIG